MVGIAVMGEQEGAKHTGLGGFGVQQGGGGMAANLN